MITIPERAKEYNKLLKKVNEQIDYCDRVHPSLGIVEIIKIETPSFLNGGKSIGAKRQQGLNKANGKYVCWLDDDDDISPDYVETLLRLAYINNPDILVFNNISRFENFWCLVQMNLDFKQDEQAHPGIVHRRPYHVCAWKKELLNGISFPDQNWDEDTAFINEALNRCKIQAKTEAILHEYKRGKRKSEAWRKEQ